MLFNLNVFQINAHSIQTVTSGIAINAPVSKVYSLLTNTYELSKWDAQKVSNRHVKVNNTIFIIADEVVDTYVEWRCLNSENTLNHSISFELIAGNECTLLNFSEKQWCIYNNGIMLDIDWESKLLLFKAECEKYKPGLKLKIVSIF
ncbi:MAG: hypothetical protein EOO45_01475 [Flavobacterium sp.]|nr:MAG: hypothetical protein EOO45_01475 [Flavobacterium sp.]